MVWLGEGGTTLQLTDRPGDVAATAGLSAPATGPVQTFESDEFGKLPASRAAVSRAAGR